MKSIARYIRVSSLSQNTGSQERANPDEQVFTDKVSGTIEFHLRPAGAKLLEAIDKGHIKEVRIYSVDRVGRKAINILNVLNLFKEKGVNVVIEQLNTSSMIDGKPNMYFDLVTGILSSISQADRMNILEKQKLGIQKAKQLEEATGVKVYKGRKVGTGLTDEQVLAKYPKVVKEIKLAPKMSLEKMAKLCDVAPNTVKRVKATMQRLELI